MSRVITSYSIHYTKLYEFRIPVDRAIDLMVNEAAAEGVRPISNEVRLTR